MEEWRNTVTTEYLLRLRNFYSNYFEDEVLMNSFIYHNLKYNNKKRRMMNMVMRHVKISEYMKGYDNDTEILVLINIIIAIEAVYTISIDENEKVKFKKVEMLIDFFNKYIINGDREKILREFKIDIEKMLSYKREGIVINELEAFALYLNEIRNIYVHEGDFWGIVFTKDKEWTMLQIIDFSPKKGEKKTENTITTSLTLNEIKSIIIKGLINYIKLYN